MASQPIIQHSFASGELAPQLYSRVDLAKYHQAAGLLRNFFVDYRGGATTRPGTKYILQAKSTTVRLIPFTASFTVTYMLEFGPGYVRFYYQGAPVLEATKTITGITQANPGVVTSASHGYSNGDWVYITGVAGMTQVNGNYYIVQGVTTNTFQLTDLYGSNVDTTSFGAYTSGGTAARVYTLNGASVPYQASDLAGIKYVQNLNTLILCHPNYPPQLLTLNSAASWTMAPISFVPTIGTPVGLSVSVTGSGSSYAQYTVTAVDSNGQESSPSTPFITGAAVGTATTQTVTWTATTGALSYNVYRSAFGGVNTFPSSQPMGFIGNVSTNKLIDANTTPDFTNLSPTVQNPFSGAGVASLTLTAGGTGYTSVPSVTFSGGSPSVPATGYCYLGALSVSIVDGGAFAAGGVIPTGQTLNLGNGVTLLITSYTIIVGPTFVITGVTISNRGQITSGSVPSNPITGTSSALSGEVERWPTFNVTWSVQAIALSSPGSGYSGAPTVNFSASGGSGAAATAALGASSSGNPQVPAFVQQRLFLGGPVLSPGQFNMSQPGAPYNFNVTFPTEADNAIQGTLNNTVLNTIKSAVPVSAGLIILSDKGAWLLNGGSPGSAISATQLVANPQAYSGASDLPPITTPNDLLYVQSKNSIVRDLAFNFYLNNYVGEDISVLSSHLFYGYSMIQWAWAEEPFKLVWMVRNDGQLLSLTFVKEQQLVAWAHHDTNGTFTSVASINEPATNLGNLDAIYVAVQRMINGQTVVYIERMVELTYPQDYISSWQVDAGIGYNGSPATTFSGAQHLAGAVVTGLADGVVINFTMPTNGTFKFGPGGTTGLTGIANASVVTVGLAFSPQLQTLPLDTGEPTIQGKRKKVSGVNLKVNNALGLSMGRTLSTVQPLADLVLGNTGSQTNALVSGLVFGDVRGYNDPMWDVPGQYYITQPNPYPASILGVMPEIEVGDTK